MGRRLVYLTICLIGGATLGKAQQPSTLAALRAPRVQISDPTTDYSPTSANNGAIIIHINPETQAKLRNRTLWIRVLQYRKDALKEMARVVTVRDTCITIHQSSLYPLQRVGSQLVLGSLTYGWLLPEGDGFKSTHYTLVVEDVPLDHTDNQPYVAPLRITRADLKNYLESAVQILIVPQPGAKRSNVQIVPFLGPAPAPSVSCLTLQMTRDIKDQNNRAEIDVESEAIRTSMVGHTAARAFEPERFPPTPQTAERFVSLRHAQCQLE